MSFQEILRPCGRAPVPPCSQAPPAPDWRQTLYRTRSGIMRLLGASLCRRAPVSAGTTPPGPPSDQTLEMNLAKSRHAPPGAIATQIASQPGQTPTLLLLLPLPASCAMARRPPPPPPLPAAVLPHAERPPRAAACRTVRTPSVPLLVELPPAMTARGGGTKQEIPGKAGELRWRRRRLRWWRRVVAGGGGGSTCHLE